MAITVEMWSSEIISNLFDDPSFKKYAVNHNQFVNEGKTVHVPKAGGKSVVTINRSVLPATVTARTDKDIKYDLAEYTTPPMLIKNAEMVELSYDKMASVLAEDIGSLEEKKYLNLTYIWVGNRAETTGTVYSNVALPAGNVFKTTGTDNGSGMKKFTLEDFKKVRKAMNKAKIPKQNRIAMFSADMEDDLYSIPQFTDADKLGYSNIPEGAIGRLLGFWIMVRADMPLYTEAPAGTVVLKGIDDAAAPTDRYSSIFWQESCVAVADGEVLTFPEQGKADYYGDLVSVLSRAGGIRLRDEGVYVTVQVQV